MLPPASAVALAKSLMLKFFYMMGNALSGKLSCPCDRSCFHYCFPWVIIDHLFPLDSPLIQT